MVLASEHPSLLVLDIVYVLVAQEGAQFLPCLRAGPGTEGCPGALNPVHNRETFPPGLQDAKNVVHLALRQAAAQMVLNPFLSNLPRSP